MHEARMHEPKTILVPVDFSAHSRAAGIRACDLALASGLSVHLLHALDLPTIAKRKQIAAHLWDELRQSEEEAFDELRKDLTLRGAPIEVTMDEGDPVDLIAGLANPERVELIVMGTHGFGGLGRLFLGSVAERTVRMSSVPVMTVKENEWDAAVKIRHILLATDFSEDSEEAVDLAIRWAQRLGADVDVFHALSEVEVGAEPGMGSDAKNRRRQEKREQALEGLQSVLGRMSAAGVPAGADLTYGAASVEIVKRATQSRANLVVMGRRGQSCLDHVLFGSIAERVLRHVKCSVLLAPGQHDDRVDSGPTPNL